MKRLLLAWMMTLALVLPAMAQHEPAAASHGSTAVPQTHENAASGEATGDHGRKHEVIEFDAANAVWVLIIFGILLAVLYPTAWKQILASLKAREERIRKDIADAEASRQRAEQTLREYEQQLAGAEEKVRQMMTTAAADAEKIATGVRMKAQQEAEEIKERTGRDLEAARKAAVNEFRQFAADVATKAAEQIIRRNLNADDQREIVNRSLEQLDHAN